MLLIVTLHLIVLLQKPWICTYDSGVILRNCGGARSHRIPVTSQCCFNLTHKKVMTSDCQRQTAVLWLYIPVGLHLKLTCAAINTYCS